MKRTLAAASLALALGAPAAFASPLGYTDYKQGDVTAASPSRPSLGLLLVGGGEWDYDAFRWFMAKARHGHIVVLSASGDGATGEELYKQVGGALSVETLQFDDRKAANDPKVLAIIRHADGIFIAGGDQSHYVNYWKDTPVARAIDAHVAAGKPIGGTSAGLAILGGTAYGALDGGSIESATALGDPMGPKVTLVHGFLHMPYLAHIVTDTHFMKRGRLGRLIAFVAQARKDGDHKAVGLGVDEKGALCVEPDGTAKLYTPNGGHAWLVEPAGAPQTAIAGKPLDWSNLRITAIGSDSAIDLKTLKVTRPSVIATSSVKAGHLIDAPDGGPAAAMAAVSLAYVR